MRRYVHLHCTPLADRDVVEIDGFRVTSLARTVVDLASSLDALHAVPIGDAALRNGLRPDQLAQLVDESGGRRGIAGARRSLALLDARSESPGESMSRVVFHQHRVPPPELQLEVFSAHGTLVGRTDFGWREQRTLGEFDGRSKYGRLLLRPGQTPEQALFEEKRREDALRDLGWEDGPLDLGGPLRTQRAARPACPGVCSWLAPGIRHLCGRFPTLRPLSNVAADISAATESSGRKVVNGRNVRVQPWVGWMVRCPACRSDAYPGQIDPRPGRARR